MAAPKKDTPAAAVPVQAADQVQAGPVDAISLADASLVDTAPALVGVAMVRLVAIEPIRADGVDIAPGEVFELAWGAAESLLACGAAEPDTTLDTTP